MKPVLPKGMKVLARPKGRHFHALLACMMVDAEGPDDDRYQVISLAEAARRALQECGCVDEWKVMKFGARKP